MSYLLDTDHVSLLQRREGTLWKKIDERMARHPGAVFFSIVSFHEQVLGAHALLNKSNDPTRLPFAYRILERTFSTFQIVPLLPFDEAAAEQFKYLLSLNLRIGKMDLRIAASALTCKLTLVTRNRSDFERIPDLGLEDWTK